MLSPRSSKVILLPQDRQIIGMLGWTEDQYRYFVRQASTHNSLRPGEPTAFFIIPFLIKLAIGLALSYLASRLSRKQNSNPPQLTNSQIDGQNIVSGGRYAPRAGFGSTQNVVELGSVVPVVFAKRELIDGIWYGGVRINTNLVWSQLYSQGSGQLLRAVFMIGEGPIGALDPYQFAIGDNLLSSYELDSTSNTSGRCSIYFRPGGGMIRSTDHIAGRLAAYDDGNAENSGGANVFDVRGVNRVYNNDFCYVSKPNNQTTFGLYAGMGNNLGYRVNPIIRSTSNAQLKPSGGSSTNSYVTCNPDSQGKAERLKQNAIFSSRSGMWSRNGVGTTDGQTINLAIGDTVQYHLSSTSDCGTVFAYIAQPIGIVKCIDVAQTVAGRQSQWDDSIVVGELYKFGQALLICTSRSPDDAVFISEAQNEPVGGGVSITATFRVIKGGLAIFTSAAEISRGALTPGGNRNNGTQRSHLFRCAISSFVVDRPTQVIEIGYKSTLGLRYNGFCNVRDSYSYFYSDLVSCDLYSGVTVGQGQTFNTTNLTSGTISLPEKRYSFFRVLFRIAGSDAAHTELDVNFCFCSQTQQASFDYLILQFPSAQRWEVSHRPTSGWEIRNSLCAGPLILLDARSAGPAKTGSANGVVFNYSGEVLSNNSFTFGLAPTIPRAGDLGLGGMDGVSQVDAYGALAEIFMWEEIQSSASQPENEIAYVNLISQNPSTPTYANLALLGLTLRSGPGFSELNQFSAYVNLGFGATHLFPECYYIALTNDLFGVGDILSPAQINSDSFAYSASWNYDRRYFYDVGISNPVNLRSKGAELAKLFLLDLSTKNGQFYLNPIAEFGMVYQPVAMFTSGNADTVKVIERDSQERMPIRVSVKWREERQSSDTAGRGLFPVIREITVRKAGTPDSAPLVPLDISEFGTSERHAIDVAKMRCQEQELITHDVQLNMLPDHAALQPGAVFKVGMELRTFAQPNNGVILTDGTATTTTGTPLSDGTYDVVLWDGTTPDLTEVTVLVTDGKIADYNDAVFCIADAVQQEQIFKAQVIDYDDDGNLEVIASFYPLEPDGTSSLLKDWDEEDAWVIEGLIGALPPDTPLAPAFTGVRISGPISAVKSIPYTYIAEIDGPSDAAYTYSWTGTGATISSPSAASTVVTFSPAGTAVLNLTATKTVGGVSRSTSKTITVTLSGVNDVSIGGPASRTGPGAVTLTADILNPYTTATYSWTLTGEGTFSAPTGASTLLTMDATEGARIVNLAAVIDGVNYSAIKIVSVVAAAAPAELLGTGTLVATGTAEVIVDGVAELLGTGSLVATGSAEVYVEGIATLLGTGTLEATGTVVSPGPSLLIHLDASDTSSGYTTDANGLLQLVDLSGNGRHFNRVNPSLGWSTTTQNGLNAFAWAGGRFTMAGSAAASDFLHTTPVTVFLVCKPTNNSNPGFLISLFGASIDASGIGFTLGHTDNGATNDAAFVYITSGTTFSAAPVYHQTSNNTFTANVTQLVTWLSDPTNATVADRSSVSINSGSNSGANSNTGTIATPSGVPADLMGNSNATYNPNGGVFCELRVYDGVLGSTDVSTIKSSIITKWGL